MIIVALFLVATLTISPPDAENWCLVGHEVMVPDGRTGPVLATSGVECQVLVYGEKYVSHWAYYLLEPVYPQKLPRYNFGH